MVSEDPLIIPSTCRDVVTTIFVRVFRRMDTLTPQDDGFERDTKGSGVVHGSGLGVPV